MKKASVFTPAVCYEIAVPFLRSAFAQRLIIEDDLRWRRVAARETFDGLADGSLCRMLGDKFR
jgi:hypothetical protein